MPEAVSENRETNFSAVKASDQQAITLGSEQKPSRIMSGPATEQVNTIVEHSVKGQSTNLAKALENNAESVQPSSHRMTIENVPEESATKEEESKYSISQHQLNMPLTDFYDKKYGGTNMQSNYAQKYYADQDDRRGSQMH